jgi:hypothetical protein
MHDAATRDFLENQVTNDGRLAAPGFVRQLAEELAFELV